MKNNVLTQSIKVNVHHVTCVNLQIARTLLQYAPFIVAYLKEIKTKSGKYRVAFGFYYSADNARRVSHFTTGYLTSTTSHRFMCSL